ncbi:MAG TPA: histidine kinase [Fulvivirga sp.]|nr:histidine kinase [Fulvivirga sp.]
MRHPFLGRSFIFYSIAWAVIIAAHAFVYNYQFGFSWSLAISDSLIFNLPMMGFGMSYWFIVQYISPSNQGLTNTIFNQSMVIIIGVALLTYASHSAVMQFSVVEEHKIFLNAALPWRIFLGSFFMAMIVMIYYLLEYTHNLKEKEQDELQLQNLLKNAELEMLKSQLNPHFIFNSLNSVSSLTLTNPDLAHEMVIKLSDFLRLSLGRSNAELHTVEEELKQMNLYLDIERVRFGDRLSLSADINNACLKKQLPAMLLQPLYENAIKYGVYEQLEDVAIKTTCSCDDENLYLAISNNYDSTSAPQKGKGIGLKNVRNRLELLFGAPDLVTIEKDKYTFTIHLQIPQKTV